MSRVPAPVPSRVSVRRTSVSPVLRSIVRACGLMRCWHSRRTRASIDSACTSKPSARAIGAPAAASLAAASPIRTSAIAAAEVARREHRGEARRAARRQDVVGARDVVAEGGRAVGADEQAAGRADRGASASTSAPISCRCSGANALASASASRALGRPRRARTRPRRRSGARRTSVSSCAGERVADAAPTGETRRRRGCPRRARPGRACRAPPGARRRSPACAPSRTSRSLGPAKPSIPTIAESWRLASCT